MVLNHYNGTIQFHCQLLNYLETRCNKEARDMLENIQINHLTDGSGKSLLHWSAELGNVEMVHHFLEEQFNIDGQDNDGNTPLMLAIEAGEECTIKALMEAGANVYLVNKKGECPINVVFTSWFLPGRKVVKLFLVRLQDDSGSDKQVLVNKLMDFECPIYFTVLLRVSEITRMMLDRGCRIEARCPKVCDTALHEAVAQSDLGNVKLLVERGLSVDSLNYREQTPLSRYSVWSKDSEEKLEMLRFLAAKGGVLCYPEKSSPVDRLFKRGQQETVRTLLQIKSMNSRRRYYKDNTALHLICMNDNPGMTKLIRLFRGKDFDIDAMDQYSGDTALMVAARKGCVDKVECLLEMGASVDRYNVTLNALCRASNPQNDWARETSKNYKRIVELMLQHGADIQLYRRISFLEEFTINGDFDLAETYLARLAQKKTLCDYHFDRSILYEIRHAQRYEIYFAWCMKQLEEMKSFVVHGSITLLALLTESQKKLNFYARNDKFVSRFNSTVVKKLESIPRYYSNTIQMRVAAAIKRANLEQKAIAGICKILGLVLDKRNISFEVVKYLDEQDIKNVIESMSA